MTETMWTLAGDAEAWALASGPGWTTEAELQAVRAAQQEVAALRARAVRLAAEVETRRAALREEAWAAAREEIDAACAALSAARAAAATRGTAVGLEVAKLLVGDALTANPEAIFPLVERALAGHRGVAESVRVAPPWVDVIRRGFPGMPVEADARLAAGDVVVVFPDGQVSSRLGEALARLASVIDADSA